MRTSREYRHVLKTIEVTAEKLDKGLFLGRGERLVAYVECFRRGRWFIFRLLVDSEQLITVRQK